MIIIVVQLPFDDGAVRNRCVNALPAPPYAAALASTATARDGASARECSLRRSQSDGCAARVASVLRVRRRPRVRDARAVTAVPLVRRQPTRERPPPRWCAASWRRRSAALRYEASSAPSSLSRPRRSHRRGGGGVLCCCTCARAPARPSNAPSPARRAHAIVCVASSLRWAARQHGSTVLGGRMPRRQARRTAADARLFAAAACAQCTSRDHARQPRTWRRSRRLRSSPPPNGPR